MEAIGRPGNPNPTEENMLTQEEKIKCLMEKFMYDFVEDEYWYKNTIDFFKEDMAADCIDVDDVYFDLSRSSTAVITGSVDVYKFIQQHAKEMIKTHKLNPFELRKLIKQDEPYETIDVYAILSATWRDNQDMEYSLNYDDCGDHDENLVAFMEGSLEDWIKEHVEEWGNKIRDSLEADYDYYTSEEYIIEELQIREIIDENLDFIDPEESIYPEDEDEDDYHPQALAA
jgi:hypothetical protein